MQQFRTANNTLFENKRTHNPKKSSKNPLQMSVQHTTSSRVIFWYCASVSDINPNEAV